MLLNKQEKKEKDILYLKRRSKELYEMIYRSPLVEIDEPFQSGWVMFLDYRSDIKNRNDYHKYKNVLDIIKTKRYTRNVKLIQEIRKNNSYIKYPVKLDINTYGHNSFKKTISKKSFDTIPRELKKFFDLKMEGKTENYSCNIPNYYFIVKIEKNMITHKRLVDPKLQSELVKTDQKLYGLGIYSYLYKSYPLLKKEKLESKKEIKKYISGVVDDIINLKIFKEYKY